MDVLFLGADKSVGAVCNYYLDTLAIVARHHRVWCYGPGYDGYAPSDRIEDVLAKAPSPPDLIVIGQSWENDTHPTEFDLHPALRLDGLDIPKVMFLNKEYKKLDAKLSWIRDQRVDLVLSTIPSIVHTQPTDGPRFVHLPFAVNTELFYAGDQPRDIDVGFAGSLHLQYTALRFRVREELRSDTYKNLAVHWGDWSNGGTFVGDDYAEFMRRCVVSFCSPSALDCVGTRFLEIMASGSLLFCPASTEYRRLFEPDIHCVTFAQDMSDFREKLMWILHDDDARDAITQNAVHHVRTRHGLSARAFELNRVLVEELGILERSTVGAG